MNEDLQERNRVLELAHRQMQATLDHAFDKIRELEQRLAQAGDAIELQEAEQRGFERGRATLAQG